MLQGQIALVTGASRGIGQAIALELGRNGATVIGTATSDKGAEAIGEYLSTANIKGGGMNLNVTRAEEVEATLTTINALHGGINILVNNAGITRDNLLMRMKDEEWDDIIATNLTSVFRLSRAVLRAMMKAPVASFRLPRWWGPWAMPDRPITAQPRPASWGLPSRWRVKSAAATSPSTAWRRVLSIPT